MSEVLSSRTISGDLIHHVRRLYEMALDDIAEGKGVRKGINGYTYHAFPAYIIAVSSVEAFVNEEFLSFMAQAYLKNSPPWKNSPIWNLPKDWLEGIELKQKLVLVPQLLFGQSFIPNAQPFQDMALLIKVRNDLVHYKMQGHPPKYLKHLDERRISLVATSSLDADYIWPSKLSTSEGIRWAHNTACVTVQKLASFATSLPYYTTLSYAVENFSPIRDSYVEGWFATHGIDLNSNDP